MYEIFNEDSKNVFNRVLDKLGIQYEIDYIKELINCYREHMPDIKLYDDAKYIIETLHQKGIKLGMITDGYQGYGTRGKSPYPGSQPTGRAYTRPHAGRKWENAEMQSQKLHQGCSGVARCLRKSGHPHSQRNETGTNA